jgi:FHA domain
VQSIALTLLQAGFLLLLYLFVARAVRMVWRDVVRGRPPPVPTQAPVTAGRASQPPAAPPPAAVHAAPAHPQPRRGAPAELVVHAEGKPRVVALEGGDVVFGRATDATVPLSDQYASERHARVYQRDGEWLVADLGSTNGTFLNQERVTTPTPISAGDQLGIGETVVQVRR